MVPEGQPSQSFVLRGEELYVPDLLPSWLSKKTKKQKKNAFSSVVSEIIAASNNGRFTYQIIHVLIL